MRSNNTTEIWCRSPLVIGKRFTKSNHCRLVITPSQSNNLELLLDDSVCFDADLLPRNQFVKERIVHREVQVEYLFHKVVNGNVPGHSYRYEPSFGFWGNIYQHLRGSFWTGDRTRLVQKIQRESNGFAI